MLKAQGIILKSLIFLGENSSMNLNPNSNINFTARNRPIKVAYLVPSHEIQENHWILDAIFFEADARWEDYHG